ncbi:hypothetical protein GW17_00034043 [Ensete ventricosum]|nr:hypothetical protein GW17_00034043 [Ensete ventricosum]
MQSGGRPAVDTPPLPFTPADVPRAPPIVFRTLSGRLRHCHAGSMEESPESGRGKAAAVAPRYKGVRRRKWGTWVAEVRLPSSRARLWLGSYPTPEMAALAHDAAVYSLRGPGAARNFLGHPPACRCSGEGSFGSRTPPGLLLAGEWLPEFAEFNAGGMRWSIEEDEDFWVSGGGVHDDDIYGSSFSDLIVINDASTLNDFEIYTGEVDTEKLYDAYEDSALRLVLVLNGCSIE